MSAVSRRKFIGSAATVAGAAAIGATLPGVSAAATGPQAASAPHGRPHGDIRDIKHVVVIMQENRSFDHYFGTLKGVRGFGDRSTIQLPGGKSVWEQPKTPTQGAGTQYPWRLSGATSWDGSTPPSAELGAANYGGTSHGWADQHGAWYGGLMNGWYSAKGGPTTLGYLDRKDLPFHYALADAYTVGDAYHCSVLSATGPNRTYLWGGTVNADKKHGSYTANDGGDERGKFLPWESYAETLQKAGVSWRVYQCADDYGDNGLEYFDTIARLDPTQGGTAAPGNVYYDNGVKNVPEPATGLAGNADNINAAIRADVLGGTLPKVSWIVNNQFFSEHPVTAPSNGAYFMRGVLEALNADPEVFNSTLVIINYDENDGQFDHVAPPVPAPGEADEFVSGTMGQYGVTEPLPVGLGFRVPLLLVSPWTRGGWVTSEVSDHTSVIQLMEKWTTALGTPAVSPNISAWRRKVCGDLTGALDFTSPVYGLPDLPDTGELIPETRYTPLPGDNTMPTQEHGTKPARPLPYQPDAQARLARGGVRVDLGNTGRSSAHFTLYPYAGEFPVPQHRDVKGAARCTVPVNGSAYRFTVTGPNGFRREFAGPAEGGATAGAEVASRIDAHERDLHLTLRNNGRTTLTFTVRPLGYVDAADLRDWTRTIKVKPGRDRTVVHSAADAHGWYDLEVTVDGAGAFRRRLMGHIENGRPSVSG